MSCLDFPNILKNISIMDTMKCISDVNSVLQRWTLVFQLHENHYSKNTFQINRKNFALKTRFLTNFCLERTWKVHSTYTTQIELLSLNFFFFWNSSNTLNIEKVCKVRIHNRKKWLARLFSRCTLKNTQNYEKYSAPAIAWSALKHIKRQ